MMRIKGKEVPKGVSKTYTPESLWHVLSLIMCDLLWVGVTLEIELWYVYRQNERRLDYPAQKWKLYEVIDEFITGQKM